MANRVNSGGLPPTNVDLDSSQTLSSKTLDSSNTLDGTQLSNADVTNALVLQEQSATPSNPTAGDKKFYAKDDGKVYTLDSDGNEIEVGSGAGAGVLYINEDFETGVSSLVAYKDAAQTTPQDGTGGSPALTVNLETVAPLVGPQSARINVPAGASKLGEGAAILSETVDSAFSDKVHTVELLWKTSAGYTAGDMSLWVVHPTTGTVEALNFRTALGEYTNELPASDSTVTRIVSELTPIDSTYRIVLHVRTANVDYDVFVDNIQCGPQRTFNAPIVTEWESFTPVWDSDNNNVVLGNGVLSGKYRRVGESAEIQINFDPGSTTLYGTGGWNFTIPSGLSIDAAKVPNLTSNVTTFGVANAVDEGTAFKDAHVVYNTATTVKIIQDGAADAWSASSPFTWTSNDSLAMKFSVPIQGWDAGAAFSTTQVDQQTAITRISKTTNQIGFTNGDVVQFEQAEIDTHNAFDNANNAFIAPRSGKVTASGYFLFSPGLGVNFDANVQVRVNGVARGGAAHAGTTGSSGGNAGLFLPAITVEVQAGDSVDFVVAATTSGTKNIASAFTYAQFIMEPDFTVFGTFPEKNLVQTKTLSSDVTSVGSTSLTDLTFSNLTVGKWYELRLSSLFASEGGTFGNTRIDVVHNSSTVLRCLFDERDAATDFTTVSANYVFKAENTTLTFIGVINATGDRIFGDGSTVETWAQLEERNDLRETDKF